MNDKEIEEKIRTAEKIIDSYNKWGHFTDGSFQEDCSRKGLDVKWRNLTGVYPNIEDVRRFLSER